jgi:hypothetical protein
MRILMSYLFSTRLNDLAILSYAIRLHRQWMRDTKRKTTTRPATDSEASETWEKKRPYIDSNGDPGAFYTENSPNR